MTNQEYHVSQNARGRSRYHSNKTCSHAAERVKEVDEHFIESKGLQPCSICFGDGSTTNNTTTWKYQRLRGVWDDD